MVKMKVIYEGDLRCKLIHEQSGSAISTDAPKDNQGKGEAFSPMDLLAAALGSCPRSIHLALTPPLDAVEDVISALVLRV